MLDIAGSLLANRGFESRRPDQGGNFGVSWPLWLLAEITQMLIYPSPSETFEARGTIAAKENFPPDRPRARRQVG